VTEERVEAGKYNDDRLGRSLDLLFVADRASFLTEVSAKAIVVHQLETETIHNDSTSVTFLGAYDADDPKAVTITHGYNKDHRPDCKQIVFGLNITEDGHVPLGYQLYDGNHADVTTHIPNWQHLRELLDREDFVYVADSKLCAEENLRTIAANGGRFITVVPRNLREVKDFLERVGNGEDIVWQYRHEVPDSRKQGRMQTYRIHVGEVMDEGARILWVHSTAKARLEQNNREQRIGKAVRGTLSREEDKDWYCLPSGVAAANVQVFGLRGADVTLSVVAGAGAREVTFNGAPAGGDEVVALQGMPSPVCVSVRRASADARGIAAVADGSYQIVFQ